MAVSVHHALTATTPDDPAYEIRPSHWNAVHTVSGLGNAAEANIGTSAGTVLAGDDWRLQPQQVVQVSKDATDIAGKWYSTVKEACDYAATVATSSNRIAVVVYPGEYTESPFTIPGFTYVTGLDDWGGVHIKTNDNSVDFITLAASSGGHKFAVTGPTAAGKAALKQSVAGTTKLAWIVIRAGDYGVYCTAGRIHTIGVVNDSGTTPSRLFCADGTGALVMLASHAMVGAFTGKYGLHVSGSARALMDLCVFRCSGGTGVYVEGSAYVRGNSCSLVSGATGVQQEGSASTIHLSGCDIAPGAFTTDILCNGTGSSAFTFSGYATHTKVSVTGTITPVLNFADAAAGHPGQHTFGEAYIGPDIATGATPVTSYIDAVATTGHFTGGEVTRATGRSVDVAAGSAMFDQGQIMTRVDWAAATITLAANTDENWIVVDSAGTVSSVTADPDPTTTVVLAFAVTDATDVMFLTRAGVDLGNLPERVTHFVEHALGSYIESGGTVSANGLGFDVGEGWSFIGLANTNFTATVAAAFYYWRRDGAGGWVQLASQIAVNATQYDDGTGTLAAMTADYYRGDTVFVAHPNGDKEFHVVIGQSEHASPSQAKIAPVALPEALSEYSCRLALLIVKKSAAAIDSVQDKRVIGEQLRSDYPPHNILSAGTQVANISGVVKFADSNGVSWGMGNNSQITATVKTDYLTTAAQSNHSHGNPALFLTNISGTTASNSAGLTLSLSVGAGGAGDGVNVLAAGTQTANTTGSVRFADANGVTWGMSNNSVITASVGTAAPGSISAGTTRVALGEVVFSNSGGVSFGVNGSTVTATVATNYQSQGAYLTTARASTDAVGLGTAKTNVTWTVNSAGISLDGGAYLTTAAAVGHSHGVSFTSGSVGFQTLSFTNSNGISFNSGTQGIFGSHNAITTGRASTDAIGLNTAQTNVTWTVNSSGLSVNAGGYAGTTSGFAGANISGSMTHNSVGLNLSLSVGAQTAQPVAASGSNGSFAFSTLSFGNLNGLSFYTSNGSLVGSYTDAGAGGGVNFSAGTTSSALAAVTFANANRVSFGLGTGASAGVVTASVGNNLSYFAPYDDAVRVAGAQGQSSLHMAPVAFPNLQHDRIGLSILWSNSAASTGSATISMHVGVYTKNVSTLSLSQSVSTSFGITFSGTGGNWSNQGGIRILTIPWTTTWPAGDYWVGILSATTTGGGNGSASQMLMSQVNSNFSGVFGAASAATAQQQLGLGVYTAQTAALPNSVGFTQLNGTASLVARPPTWAMLNGTV